MAKMETYTPVVAGLTKGLENLAKWYRNMDDTNIYFISLILDPGIKLEYFKTNWDADYLKCGIGILYTVVRFH